MRVRVCDRNNTLLRVKIGTEAIEYMAFLNEASADSRSLEEENFIVIKVSPSHFVIKSIDSETFMNVYLVK